MLPGEALSLPGTWNNLEQERDVCGDGVLRKVGEAHLTRQLVRKQVWKT